MVAAVPDISQLLWCSDLPRRCPVDASDEGYQQRMYPDESQFRAGLERVGSYCGKATTARPPITLTQSRSVESTFVRHGRICLYGPKYGARSRTFFSFEKDQRGTPEPANVGENRNDQCESSHGLPERCRTRPASQRSRAAMAGDPGGRKRSIQADVAGHEPARCHG